MRQNPILGEAGGDLLMRWKLIIPLALFLAPGVAYCQEEAGWREHMAQRAAEIAKRSQERISENYEAATEASRQALDWSRGTWKDIGERVSPVYERSVEAVSEHSSALRDETILAFSRAYNYSADASNAIYESLSRNAAAGTTYLLEVGTDGALQMYQASASGMSGMSEWSQERFLQLQEIDYCELDLIDMAGGAVAGVAVTSFFSGVNITGATLLAVPTASGWLPLLAPLATPAIPAGVTLAAGAGVLIYASTKGYCWVTAPVDVQAEGHGLDAVHTEVNTID